MFPAPAMATTWAEVAKDLRDVAGSTGPSDGDNPYRPGRDTAMNVDRATFNAVATDVSDWTEAVYATRNHMLGPDFGIRTLVEDTFVTNEDLVDAIAHDILANENPAFTALFAGLLRGFISVIGTAVGGPVASAIAAMVGAGVAGGIGFVNPTAAVNTERDSLRATIRQTFCASSNFLAASFDQIVADYGLLTANLGSVKATAFPNATARQQTQNAMTAAQELWIWQQFGNRSGVADNFTVGWCDLSEPVNAFADGCPWGASDLNTWSAPEKPDIVYRLIGEFGGTYSCAYDLLANQPDLARQNLRSGAIFAPRQSDTGGKPDGTDSGGGIANNIGTSGWRLGSMNCTQYDPPG